MAEVWEHAEVEATRLLLLLALADFANDEGVCWPSVARLAKKARVKERCVQTIMRDFRRDGTVAVEPNAGPNGVNVYTLKLGGGACCAPLKPNAPGVHATAGVHDTVRGGARQRNLGVHRHAPKPSLEPSLVEPSLAAATAGAHAREEKPETHDDNLAWLLNAHENAIGLVSGPMELAILEDWAGRIPDGEIGEASINHAFKQAVLNRVPTLNYVESVLKRLEREGWPRDMEAGHGRSGKAWQGRNGRSAAEIEADPANTAAAERFLASGGR